MNVISAQTGVQFVERTGHNDYIEFAPSSDNFCSSHVGRKGGKQIISLANYCQLDNAQHIGVIIHEILHALGFEHTHNRSDRDNYITVNITNIKPAGRSNFNKFGTFDTTRTNYGSYDLFSVMHYSNFTSSTDFVFDVNIPMLSVNESSTINTGNNTLSSNDISTLRSVYGAVPAPNLSGITDYCHGGTTLGWNPIDDAVLYRIEYLVYGSWIQIATTTSSSKYINVDRSADTRVLACDASGECSLPSNSFYAHYYPICY